MSDYAHKKAVRLPFPKELLEKFNTDDPWNCGGYLKEKLGDLWDSRKNNSFEIEYTYRDDGGRYYLDWRYYYTYGEESGDWSNARLLTEKELETIKPVFDKLGIEYKDEDLRVVDYCYYNACEPGDCYDVDGDDSDEFINPTNNQ